MAKINIAKLHEENKDNDFELMPIGKYQCFVYDMEAGISRNKNQKIDITLKVATGDYHNRRLWTNITLTPEAWWKAEEFFDAVGYDISQLPEEVETADEVVAACKDDILGSKVIAVVNHKKWEGEDRENVKKLKKPEKDFSVGDGEISEDTPF